MLFGEERVFRGTKSNGEAYRQTWFCVPQLRRLGVPDPFADDDGVAFEGIFGAPHNRRKSLV